MNLYLNINILQDWNPNYIYPSLSIRVWRIYSITNISAPNGIWTRVTSSTGSYDRPLHYRGSHVYGLHLYEFNAHRDSHA